MNGSSHISATGMRIALAVAACAAVMALSGCGGEANGSVSGPQSSPYRAGSKQDIALRTAVREARSLDAQYPHAHEATETVGMEGPRVSYDAAALVDGWTFRVAVSDSCPAGTAPGGTCGSQDDYYVVVRDGRGTIIAHTPGHGTGGYSLTGSAVADCRDYDCTPQGDFPGCDTCATVTGAQVAVSGNGQRFVVPSHAGIGFTIEAPPGVYQVEPAPFDGMTAQPRRVVVPRALGVQKPWPLFVRYR